MKRKDLQETIDACGGILRLEPCWVPRTFMHPGRRLRLHPDDLYALGGHRGGINERWFSSTTNADNGPGTPADEGLSYVRLDSGIAFQLKPAVDVAGDLLLGSDVMQREGGWNVLCKFFDNMGPIPHHMHQSDAHATLVGRKGKPEAYYFPPQYNQIDNDFPYTFMGLEPGTTKDDVRRCLENWARRQRHSQPVEGVSAAARHRLADRSRHPARARLAGDVRAAGQQRCVRDVSVTGRRPDRPWDLLVKDVPADKHETSTSSSGCSIGRPTSIPSSARGNRVFPSRSPVRGKRGRRLPGAMGVLRHRLVFGEGTDGVAARTVRIEDSAAYGLIVVQGEGTFGGHRVATPTMIRFGDMTQDELFVSRRPRRPESRSKIRAPAIRW